jgi:hypothetical protein
MIASMPAERGSAAFDPKQEAPAAIAMGEREWANRWLPQLLHSMILKK